MRILIVRLSALGDIVHALPVLAAIRDQVPEAEVDWLVDGRYVDIFEFVEGLGRHIVVRADATQAFGSEVTFAGNTGFWSALRFLRSRQYDVALDLQGLIKSAALAGLSGARRVIGFPAGHLREPPAGWFYSETARVAESAHVITKNLSVLSLLGLESSRVRFPIRIPPSRVADEVSAAAARSGDAGRFVLLNPGGGWPNKRWPPVRFGELAARLRDEQRLPSFVLWGKGDAALADQVVAHADGAATSLPVTTIGDVLAVSSRAALMVSGDTGPLHLAAAVETPIVGIYGPTWPSRNGPWHVSDVTVSRADRCQCHHKRQCQRRSRCLDEVGVDEVLRAAARRLGADEAST
ncbi:MAG: glycosyltransferase family 9 protein [Acidobacteria bacterium]|nr:glycosyltransferase family 9 protein [Acidobacteriota bacterium]